MKLIRVQMIILFGLAGLVANVHALENTSDLALGYGSLPFSLPKVGSYQLPALGEAADGNVLTTDNSHQTLHHLMGDKIVLLSFIYSTCSDVNGCPLATSVFHRIAQRLKKHPELNNNLRLITLSFNPTFDTPEQMKVYGKHFSEVYQDWHFITTASEDQIKPILKDYQQSVQKVYDAAGNFTGTFSHVLKVFLIDRNKKIRNIYSVSFLHPEILINDIKTLMLPVDKDLADTSKKAISFLPGDYRQDYNSKEYQTRNIALTDRIGKAADLLKTVIDPPLGLPNLEIPSENPITEAKVQLGRKLFYDRRLSLNNTFSCAMCHIPEQGFTSNEMKTAVGIEGRSVKRNSPTLYNVGYMKLLFHDGRENSLEQQVWGPLLANNEMGNPSIGYVVDKIKGLDDYNKQFIEAFNKGPGMETIGQAIASYERTLNSANSPFDRWYFKLFKNALSESAQRGFILFSGKANCSNCHSISKEFASFTDDSFHNTGIGYQEAMSQESGNNTINIAPGISIEVDQNIIQSVSGPKSNDLGYYEITQNPEDRWKYKTPTLRNINLTAPYMHNGSLATLSDVVEFYNQGGIKNENLDPLMIPLNLTEQEKKDLISFLSALQGDNVQDLVSDAFAAPVGDIH